MAHIIDLPPFEDGIVAHMKRVEWLQQTGGAQPVRTVTPLSEEALLVDAQSWVAVTCLAEMMDAVHREYGVKYGVPYMEQELEDLRKLQAPEFHIHQVELSIEALQTYPVDYLAALRERSDKVVDAQKLLGVHDPEVLELVRRARVARGLAIPQPGEWDRWVHLPVPMFFKRRMPKVMLVQVGLATRMVPRLVRGYRTPMCDLNASIELALQQTQAQLEKQEGLNVRAFPDSIAAAYRLPEKEQKGLVRYARSIVAQRGAAWSALHNIGEDDPDAEMLEEFGQPVSEYSKMDRAARSEFYLRLNQRLRDEVRNSAWAGFEEHIVVALLAADNKGPETEPRKGRSGKTVVRDGTVMDVFPDVVPRIFRRHGWAGQVVFVEFLPGFEFLSNSIQEVEISNATGEKADVRRKSNGVLVGKVPAESFRGRLTTELEDGAVGVRSWAMHHGRITVAHSHPWFRGGSEYAEGWPRPVPVNTPAMIAQVQAAMEFEGLVSEADAAADPNPGHTYQRVEGKPGWCRLWMCS